ncbi:MAG: hypothetical protein IKQ68_10090 [Prevotella sp.]|nr:hypothetical protein [Prevotella sp.]
MKGILIDTNTSDLLIENGKLTIGDIEPQTVELLLSTAPGEWKECPLLGADARSQLGGNTDRMWAAKTKRMIRACRIDVQSVIMQDDGTIIIQ